MVNLFKKSFPNFSKEITNYKQNPYSSSCFIACMSFGKEYTIKYDPKRNPNGFSIVGERRIISYETT